AGDVVVRCAAGGGGQGACYLAVTHARQAGHASRFGVLGVVRGRWFCNARRRVAGDALDAKLPAWSLAFVIGGTSFLRWCLGVRAWRFPQAKAAACHVVGCDAVPRFVCSSRVGAW